MTELIWEGKYKDGKKVAPVRIALPFQTIETVNESAEDRRRTLDMFASGKPTEWRNRLIWGDKKYVLPSLLPEFAGKVNLIYIDPPFDTGADFSFTATIPDNPGSEEDETAQFTKEASIIEQKAYRDTWGKGLESYLQWFYETALLLHELLADDGSIYVHLDWHVYHYAKSVLDEVFGYERFRNDIIWKRTFNTGSSKGLSNKYPANTDNILWYAKTEKYRFNRQYTEYSPGALKRFDKVDEKGRYMWVPLKTVSQEKLTRLRESGDIREDSHLRYPRYKKYLDEEKGVVVDNLWHDLGQIATHPSNIERVNFPTQKPEALLKRIINASSDEGNLVLDCFVGSGTTAVVAEKLNRQWIACDLGRFAIHSTRKRLLQIPNLKPFVVQNLGKYERQVWQGAEFSNHENRNLQEKDYRNFILDLYHAEPVNGYVWLHGFKAGRMVHVGAVDSPVALGDVKSIIQEFWKSVGKPTDKVVEVRYNGVDILGWEFAFDINETAKQQAAASKVDIKFKKIPREVLDKRAVDAGDVKFFELAALDVKIKTAGKKVEVSLNDFVIPPDDVPEDVQKAITHWSQWIDYWAVDWDYKDDTFHNQWQSYRTKKNPKIELSTSYLYPDKGKYTIVVKVIDILGNDTTKAINVETK